MLYETNFKEASIMQDLWSKSKTKAVAKQCLGLICLMVDEIARVS